MRLGLQRLRDEDLDAVPASCMDQDLVELRRHINGCEAEFVRRLTRFDTGQGYAASGALNPKPWLRWQCHLSPSAASDRVEVSRLLASLPETTDAFAVGDISYQHVAMIARTAEKLGDKMEARAESILVTAAKDMDPAQLRVVTVQLRHYMDPDAVLDDANEAHELRFLYLSQTLDGVFYLNGRLDNEGGATLQTALNALGGPPASDDKRTPKQRRADALVELARQQWIAATCLRSVASGPTLRSPSRWPLWPGSLAHLRPSSSGRSRFPLRPLAGSPAMPRLHRLCVPNRISRMRAELREYPLVRSARHSRSEIEAVGSRAATDLRIGQMRTTFNIGPTVARRRWKTWCCYAGATTAWSMKKAGSWYGTRSASW